MNVFLRSALPAVAIFALAGAAIGATPQAQGPGEAVVELSAGKVVLPADIRGTVVMKACVKCALKSYPVTPATKYYLYADSVTLPEFSAALAGHPKAYVGVVYSPKTGEVTALNAHARRVRP